MTEPINRERITVKDGWQAYVDMPTPEPPVRLTKSQVENLDPAEKKRYDSEQDPVRIEDAPDHQAFRALR